MDATTLAQRLEAKRNGSGWMARCPAHDDGKASLSIGEGRDGRALIKCHAGCSNESVVGALGLSLRDLFADSGTSHEPVATYDYTNEHGSLLFQVCRFWPKDFRQRQPDGDGGWIWNLQGVRRVLYRLPEVRAAVASGKRVFVVEGEKDADNVRAHGYAATCNPAGAGKWRTEYTAELRGADVVIVADKDETGYKHAREVAKSLEGTARAAVIVEAAEGKDVSDHLAAGRKLAELLPVSPTQCAKKANKVDGEGALFASFAHPELPRAALYGLPGEFVRVVGPHTEADPAALLVQFLVAFGSIAGRNSFYRVEADRHYLNLFALLVGVTSKGRKGTSWGHIRSVFGRLQDPKDPVTMWATNCLRSGLSSGEGLIWEVRDPIDRVEAIREKGKPTGEYQTVRVDEGVEDKRLLVIEAEFASTLKVMTREGNTLSAVIRQAWDDGMLRAMAKNSPAKSTDAHISIIGHVTRDELRRELTQTDAANGFANRFLFVSSRRSKALPEGGNLAPTALDELVQRLADAVVLALGAGEIRRDDTARALWASVYPKLSEGRPGLLGAATGRAEAQVVRLSCLYALLDGSRVVREPHLRAALALWDYCAASAATVFRDSVGDSTADDILGALRRAPEGLSRTEISDALQRHRSTDEINRALGLLHEGGWATSETVQTAGRPREVWRAVGTANEANKGRAA